MSMASQKSIIGALGWRRSILLVLLSVAALVLFVSFSSLSVPSSVLILSPISNYIYGKDASLLEKESTTSSATDQRDVETNPNVQESEKTSPSSSSAGPSSSNIGNPVPEIEQPSSESDNRSAAEGVKVNDSIISNTDAAAAASLDDGGGDETQDAKETCDLYQGKWLYDSSGPLYTNETCPIITQMQNCQGNGRPDKDYENYRWKPADCELPRFDARKFLELMRDKTVAFIGDSVARNQMESLLCLLWQVETPANKGNRRIHRWFFRSTRTYISRIWSSWLVHHHPGPFKSAPEGVEIVHLDVPDETFMEFLGRFDVLVLSSGHWFAKKSAYVLNGTIVGGQLWWPKDAGEMQVNNVAAFGISVETSLAAIAADPNYKGIAVVRSYSPDHYEGGAWNTGGSCTGKTKPVDEAVRNEFTDSMLREQTNGFERAVKKSNGAGGARLRFMDVTGPFGYRPDGHPGPYRSRDPNKKTTRGPNGEPPPQDCLHWCLPGPVDTWNELLLEEIRRGFEGFSS